MNRGGRRRPALSCLIALAGLTGCASALNRAEVQFSEGRYPEAARTLASIEIESRTWADAKRAEYALYRGLTHSALGDGDQASLWLREARAIEEAHPGCLSPENRQRLRVAADNADPE
jgi:hypothetical protein